MSSKKKLFFLEPYVFIFKNNEKRVVYNTLNSAYIVCPSNAHATELIDSLLLPGNGYCVLLDENRLHDVEFYGFIEQMRNSYSGDLVDVEQPFSKPFIFSPSLRYLKMDKQEEKDVSGREILKNLNEASFYITGACSQQCLNCSDLYKQVLHCTRNEHPDMQIGALLSLLDKIERYDIGLVHFLGGNLFEYADFAQLLSYLKNYKVKKCFVLHYKTLCDKIQDLLALDEASVLVLVDHSFVADERFLIDKIETYGHDRIEWRFIVESRNDVSNIEAIIEKYNLRFSIQPFYNKRNRLFFEEDVYLNFNDIIETPINKETIYIRQTMNELFYGKLFFFQNGDVYSNPAHTVVGNFMSETLNEIVSKEINHSTSWFNIRDKGVCKECCNQWLCPSPSNYETALNKPNLCHIE